jgi:deoxyribodipyrimidine photolyase-related protein
MTTLRLILGDQLNPQHSWFRQTDPDVVYVLQEVRSETDYVLHHAQKILALFAGMRDLARHLKEQGHRVRYVAIDAPVNRQSLTANLDALIAHYQARRVQYQAPDEHRLDAQLADWAASWREQGCAVDVVDTEHFLSTRDAVARQFGSRPQWLMEHFYRRMRVQHQVLMTQGRPEGGRWNLDHDNRQAWHGQPAAPADWRRTHDHRALWADIQTAGVPSFGNPCADALSWPLNRAEALQDLDAFIRDALPHFGQYQDAMSTRHWRLFHSLLSFALNTKMLHPREVIARIEAAWRDGQVPLSAAEGFIRQILGWREYVRGIYWAHMPGYTTRNALQHRLPLPRWFWTGHTRMACLAHAIGQSLEHAYAHHIQRLMVIGNFALLAGLDPQAVHHWYLGVYVDAFEWVEAPNTLGMSQFADGGLIATKPYVSTAAYIDRMSDHCASCIYQRKQRVGEQACPFNALYWDFFHTHRTTLQGLARLSVVYRQLDHMDATQVHAITVQAATLRQRLDAL